jgi:hypothetical protein
LYSNYFNALAQRLSTGTAFDHMFFIIHSGQSGVERGADEAARAAGLAIVGFMSPDERDELGLIPKHIASDLVAHRDKGHRPAIAANLEIASAALVVVPDRTVAAKFAPMGWVLSRIRAYGLPSLICDPSTSLADVALWCAAIPETCGSRRLAVTGPRATRWQSGEMIARRFVSAIVRIGNASPDRSPGSVYIS